MQIKNIYLYKEVLLHLCYSKHLNSLHEQKFAISDACITHIPHGIYKYHK